MPAKFTKLSPLSHQHHTLLIEQYDQDEFELRYLSWIRGEKHIEEAFSDLSANQINFIKTGITSKEWDLYNDQ